MSIGGMDLQKEKNKTKRVDILSVACPERIESLLSGI